MRDLVLLRHAQAVPAHSGGDYHRPLSLHGTQQAQQAAVNLQARAWQPDLILTSPAVRTHQTATLVAAVLSSPPVLQDATLYLAAPPALLDALHALPDTVTRVMLVGHNPGISLLAQQLHQAPAPDIILGTGQWIRLLLPAETWKNLLPGSYEQVQNVISHMQRCR